MKGGRKAATNEKPLKSGQEAKPCFKDIFRSREKEPPID